MTSRKNNHSKRQAFLIRKGWFFPLFPTKFIGISPYLWNSLINDIPRSNPTKIVTETFSFAIELVSRALRE